MATVLTEEMITKLESQQIVWFASVRADGRPHLAPIWFVWHNGKIYVGTDPKSVKSHNIHRSPQVTLALEDGVHPIICEGLALPVARPWPADLLDAFFKKYEWDMNKEEQYNEVIEITPVKWLGW
jgi:PPOX class probable F420-dependent enzyme